MPKSEERVTTRVEIVIPVLNEERAITNCIATLTAFLTNCTDWDYWVTIADNGSTDATSSIGQQLAEEFPHVRVVTIPQRGRGRALRQVWSNSNADVTCYMDVDLSTELTALPYLVKAITAEGHHVAIGSRLHADAQVYRRTLLREVVSRSYNAIIRLLFPSTRIADAQCGFKAVSKWGAHNLTPLVRDNGWFFDTELLIIAHCWKLKVAQIPVIWRDDADSRVSIIPTAVEDLKGLLRLRFSGCPPRPQDSPNR